MARYLITGAAGFIGGALVHRLTAEGHQVVAVDRPANLERAVLPPGVETVGGGVHEPETYAPLSRGGAVDAVLHLAAQSSARISHERPEEDLDSNARGTLLLLEWCRSQSVTRFLYASSMAVYGEPEQFPVDESVLPAPVANYGITKLAGEGYVRAYGQFGVAGTVFRLFNVYGPGQDLANLKQGMLSVYLAYLLKGEEIPVTGRLDRFRDFLYIDDVVEAWCRALDPADPVTGTFNLASGARTTVREALDLLVTAAGHDPADYPVKEVAGHPGDQFGMQGDSTRFRERARWSPRVSLREGIQRMVAWAKGGTPS